MKTFFYYCYYRIAKAYRNTIDEKDYCMYGSGLTFLALGGYSLSVVVFILHLFNLKLNNQIIIGVVTPFLIASLFFISKKRYELLHEKWKNERYRKLKGWLVFLFIIGSFIAFYVSLNVFDV